MAGYRVNYKDLSLTSRNHVKIIHAQLLTFVIPALGGRNRQLPRTCWVGPKLVKDSFSNRKGEWCLKNNTKGYFMASTYKCTHVYNNPLLTHTNKQANMHMYVHGYTHKMTLGYLILKTYCDEESDHIL